MATIGVASYRRHTTSFMSSLVVVIDNGVGAFRVGQHSNRAI